MGEAVCHLGNRKGEAGGKATRTISLIDRRDRHRPAAPFTSEHPALVALKRIDEFKGHLGRRDVTATTRAATADGGFGKSNHRRIPIEPSHGKTEPTGQKPSKPQPRSKLQIRHTRLTVAAACVHYERESSETSVVTFRRVGDTAVTAITFVSNGPVTIGEHPSCICLVDRMPSKSGDFHAQTLPHPCTFGKLRTQSRVIPTTPLRQAQELVGTRQMWNPGDRH